LEPFWKDACQVKELIHMPSLKKIKIQTTKILALFLLPLHFACKSAIKTQMHAPIKLKLGKHT